MQDLRDAVRSLRAAPVSTLVAMASLALGIGANTAIFSLLNALLLRPLPVREPSRLVTIASGAATSFRRPVFDEIRALPLFEGTFAASWDRFNLSSSGQVEFVEGLWAGRDLFEVLGLGAVRGRTLTAADHEPSGGANGPVAMISHDFWQRRFAGAADVVGRALTVDRVPLTIVGVTPRGFRGLNVGLGFDIVVPLGIEPLLRGGDGRYVTIMARLKPGHTADTATAALRAVQPQIRAATMPAYNFARDRAEYLREPFTVESAEAGYSFLRGRYERALYTLLVIVALVLLIACGNIAHLLLARVAARGHELSVRRALGASPLRLMRQLLCESLLLSAAGAGLGLLVARWFGRVLVAPLSTQAYTVVLDLSPDARVLGFTAAASVVTAIVFGTAPALRATRAQPVDVLKQQSRWQTGDSRAFTSVVMVGQVALSLILVAGAGLFLRSFAAVAFGDVGFDRDRVLIAIVDLKSAGDPMTRAERWERIRQAVASVPGVAGAAASLATPVGTIGNLRLMPLVDVPGSGVPEARIHGNRVSPDWFRTYGTRLIAGRDFDARDRGPARVAVVNEAFTRRYFAGANPVGRTLIETGTPGERHPFEIVGAVADAAYTSIREPVPPTMYAPLAQGEADFDTWSSINISVRVDDGRPARLTSSVAEAIGRVDGEAFIAFRSLSDQLSATYLRERLLAMVSGFFGALALLLAALGLYGLTAHSVTRRRAEIGIRMALGADPGSVMRLVLGRVATLVGAGTVIGTILGISASRMVANLLYNLQPTDPVTFIGGGLGLALVSGVAGWIPARRAVRTDPADVLRVG